MITGIDHIVIAVNSLERAIETYHSLGFTVAEDGWTLRTVDGSVSAQYEHTVIINGDDPILVTKVDGGYV